MAERVIIDKREDSVKRVSLYPSPYLSLFCICTDIN